MFVYWKVRGNANMRDTKPIGFGILNRMTPLRMLALHYLDLHFKVSRLCEIYLKFQDHTFEVLIY